MRYFKYLIFFLILILCSQNCYAENWKMIKHNGTEYIFLDMDSINYHNNSLYYNVRYIIHKTDSNGNFVTVQSKGNVAGIIQVCQRENYKTCANPYTQKVATKFNTVTEDSLLYEANKIAWREYNAINKPITNTNDRNELVLLKPYMKSVETHIKNNWQPPIGKENKKAIAQFRIAYDGRLLSCKIISSSGDKEFDNAVIKTLQNIGRFAPLPQGINEDSIDINFTFSHKYYKFF